MLVDMDEWGQILMANLLTRYARAQFLAPDAYMRDLCLDRAARGGGAPGQMALQLPHAAGGGSAFERASTQGALGGTTGFYSDSSSEDGDAGSDSDDSDAGRGAGRKGGSKSKGGAKGLVKEPKVAANVAAAAAGGADYLDDDHRLLLRCSRPLLQSQNAGVVMAVGALHFYLAPVADLPKVLRSLVFVMRCKPESQHIMLKNICTMVSVQSSLFHVHFPCFFVHPADPLDVRGLKLEILTHIVTADNAATLLRELQAYLRSANYAFVALTIRAIGRCAAVMPQIASVCIRSLLELSLHPSEKVAGEAVVVIRALVQQNPKEHTHIVMRLIRRLEMLLAPSARSAVAWLAGGELYIFGEGDSTAAVKDTHVAGVTLALAAPPAAAQSVEEGNGNAGGVGGGGGEEEGAAEVLGGIVTVEAKKANRAKKGNKREKEATREEREEREKFFELSFSVIRRSLRSFATEMDDTKLQLLNSACKLYVKDAVRVGPILKHLFDLCATDASVDIRDRVRVYRAMFAVGGNSTPLAGFRERVILCDKPAPRLPSPAAPTCAHALGSLSHCVEHVAPGYRPLPAHPAVQPPVHVRDQYYNPSSAKGGDGGKGSGGGGGGGGGGRGEFYSDSDSGSGESSDYESSDYTGSDDGSDASSMSDSDSSEDGSEEGGSGSGSDDASEDGSDDSDGDGDGSDSD